MAHVPNHQVHSHVSSRWSRPTQNSLRTGLCAATMVTTNPPVSANVHLVMDRYIDIELRFRISCLTRGGRELHRYCSINKTTVKCILILIKHLICHNWKNKSSISSGGQLKIAVWGDCCLESTRTQPWKIHIFAKSLTRQKREGGVIQ